jgi:hypothetical protein
MATGILYGESYVNGVKVTQVKIGDVVDYRIVFQVDAAIGTVQFVMQRKDTKAFPQLSNAKMNITSAGTFSTSFGWTGKELAGNYKIDCAMFLNDVQIDWKEFSYVVYSPTAPPDDLQWRSRWLEREQSLYRKLKRDIAELLFVKQYSPEISVEFSDDPSFIAGTTGNAVKMGAAYFKTHSDWENDGAMVHEFAHVIQNYPRYDNRTGWLVEGLADFVRFKLGYFEKLPQGNPKNGYQEAVHFFSYLWDTDRESFKMIATLLIKGEVYDRIEESIDQYEMKTDKFAKP